MIKDVLGTIIKEFQNEQEHINEIIGPITYKLKIAFYVTIILVLGILINATYSNILLHNLIYTSKISGLRSLDGI